MAPFATHGRPHVQSQRISLCFLRFSRFHTESTEDLCDLCMRDFPGTGGTERFRKNRNILTALE